ncbi:MAG: MarR family transcriptional regulator [Candidatus Bathyarchaeota archaeon]|nr:MarR family transcriptional regulator [Candidatus Bathyarchaeota archaeon]
MELTITTAAFLLVTVVASIIFYRKIQEATSEYEGAKESVRNITFGFTRQVNRLQQDIVKTENEVTQAKVVASEALRNSGEAKEAILKGLEAVKSLQNRVDSTESEVESIRKEMQKLALAPKQRVVVRQDVMGPIPVQQGNILSQITETELTALKKIAELGEGTVPEIKNHIGTTREHTARMLKKLYESGFVDRSTNAMPYRYSIRKEIRDIIQQQPDQRPKL